MCIILAIHLSIHFLIDHRAFFSENFICASLFSRLGALKACFEGQAPRQIPSAAALEMARVTGTGVLTPLEHLLLRGVGREAHSCKTLTRFSIRRLSESGGREGGVETMLGAGLGELLLRRRARRWRPL